MDNMKDGVLEHIESLEQAQILKNGYKIKVYETKKYCKRCGYKRRFTGSRRNN